MSIYKDKQIQDQDENLQSNSEFFKLFQLLDKVDTKWPELTLYSDDFKQKFKLVLNRNKQWINLYYQDKLAGKISTFTLQTENVIHGLEFKHLLSAQKFKIGLELVKQVTAFIQSPTQYAKNHSLETQTCMFCNRKLTAPRSIEIGYGPKCAMLYNLDYDLKKKSNSNNKQLEIEL